MSPASLVSHFFGEITTLKDIPFTNVFELGSNKPAGVLYKFDYFDHMSIRVKKSQGNLPPQTQFWQLPVRVGGAVVVCRGVFHRPNNALTTESIVTATRQPPQGSSMLLDGDFNADLSELEENAQNEVTTVALDTSGLEDMVVHFLPQNKSWERDGRTWIMLRGSRDMKYHTYYLTGTDPYIFQKVYVRDARHNTDHYLVLGCLYGYSATEHYRYLGHQWRFPLQPP